MNHKWHKWSQESISAWLHQNHPKNHPKPSKTNSRLFQLKESLLFFMAFLLFSCLLKFVLCRLSLQAAEPPKRMDIGMAPWKSNEGNNQIGSHPSRFRPLAASWISSLFSAWIHQHSDRGETAVFVVKPVGHFWPIGLELYKLPMRKERPYCTSL